MDFLKKRNLFLAVTILLVVIIVAVSAVLLRPVGPGKALWN